MANVERGLSTEELAEELEDYVDAYGLARVIDALSELCAENATHLESNWQDSAGARAWNRAGRALQLRALTEALSRLPGA